MQSRVNASGLQADSIQSGLRSCFCTAAALKGPSGFITVHAAASSPILPSTRQYHCCSPVAVLDDKVALQLPQVLQGTPQVQP
jgi:hypothetical protein